MMEFVSLLMSSVIGLGVMYVAWQQHEITKKQHQLNQYRYKMDLYDRRFKIYQFIREWLTKIGINAALETNVLTLNNIFTFIYETREAHFLFGDEVGEHIDNLCDKGFDLHNCGVLLRNLEVGKKRSEVVDEHRELLDFFSEQHGITVELFSKYLKLSELDS